MRKIKILLGSSILMLLPLGAIASDKTSTLQIDDIDYWKFSTNGGVFIINLDDKDSDLVAVVYEDDGSPAGALTGDRVGESDDGGSRNGYLCDLFKNDAPCISANYTEPYYGSYLADILPAGTYWLAVARYQCWGDSTSGNLRNGTVETADMESCAERGGMYAVPVEYDIAWFGDVSLVPEAPLIDIKPGSDHNSIKPRSNRVIPVAVLGSAGFDATQIDFSTVTFGADGATPRHYGHVEDVNDDGYMDMIFRFKTRETGIVCGDTEATLMGETFGEIQFTGTDEVKTVKCN